MLHMYTCGGNAVLNTYLYVHTYVCTYVYCAILIDEWFQFDVDLNC